MFSVMFWLPLTLGFSKMQCRKECLSHWMTKFNLRTQLSVAWLSNSLSQLCTWSKVYIYAASNVPQPICPGTSVCKLLWWNCWILRERGLAGTALTGREGPWVSTHMKGRLRHLGALMTDWAALFWLKSSFNMHDKRRPSGTFLGNSAESPDKLLWFLPLLFIMSSSVVVEVPSKRKGICLSKTICFSRPIQCSRDQHSLCTMS